MPKKTNQKSTKEEKNKPKFDPEEDNEEQELNSNFDDELYEDDEGENVDPEENQDIDDFEQNEENDEENNDIPEEIEEENEELNDVSKNKLVDVAHMNVDMSEVNLKIQSIIDTLSDFNNKKEENKSRNDYMSELKNLLMIYYDYNEEIMNLILNLFPPNEAVEFLESNNTQRVMSIRTNTIKAKRRDLAKALIQRGVNLDPLAEWTKVGLKIYESQVPIGATPEYLAGQYMLQSGSSFLPVVALAPKENEKVLDMSAAPGGKTTYIAQLMKNTGVLVANDLKKERLKSLYFNIHRLGVKNAIITNYDGRSLPTVFNSFDRVLLDAPCSGLGVISKDPSIKLNRTYKDIIQTTRIQKELLLAAIDCVSHKSKTGGVIVYSTCSISVEENEWVVDYALRNRYVKLVDAGKLNILNTLEIQIGEEGFTKFRDRRFHPSLKLTRRIYPHIHNMDGFFVAKLVKYADGSKKTEKTDDKKKMKKSKGKKSEDVQNEFQKENVVNEEDEEFNDNFEGENDEKLEDDEIEKIEAEEVKEKEFLNKKRKNKDKYGKRKKNNNK